METPSTTRRVTRSQTLSAMKSSATNHLASSSKKAEESKTRQRNGATPKQERSALFDITNDSPIVGLAMQSTPSSGVVVGKSRIKSTPGSGEALLRGQVKNLLQKVEEEESHLITKISVESRPFIHLVTSPMGLLAPTPANTPQVLDGMQIVITSPVVSEQLRAATSSQVVDVKKDESSLEKSPSITRSLLLDFSDKSELWESSDCSSVVTQNPEDDNSSVWSMQVNASAKDDEDDDEDQVVYSYREEDDEEEYYYEDEEEEVEGLCEGMRKMRFAGKHTRFVYDSDLEEMVEAEEQTPEVSRLKVFPTPTGKHHVRFADDDEEE
ncbi:Chalcone-flavonone isomerase family protein [Hirschfeldia incana]|nr:Chalcone-flavonone isomerase family protein [Hirschfeldia incana]